MATSMLTTLGGFAFKVNGVSTQGPATRKARALMAFLVMNRGAGTARDRLLELFWPNSDPDRGRDSLVTALSSIRACLRSLDARADDFLTATKSVVRWTADSVVDAERFASLAARDNDASASRAAVRLYRGDFLEGDYDDWTVAERERLTTLYETVLARAVRTSRDPEAARLLIARNPYAEEAYVALIETELEAGRNAAAATLAADFRKALAEVGEVPSPAFEERFGHIKLRSLETPPSNLPRQTTSFVGRVAELNEIAALLEKSRLTTIVGAGGVGKTRVAVHAAAQALHSFDDGIWFADLATIDGESAVVTEIASAFGVKSSGFSGLLEHIIAHIKHKRLLLVLDNCEHIVGEAARVVDAIIAACPHVTVLATSRERLAAHGEQIYRLPSLSVPPASEKPVSEEALSYGAVALFAARATASETSFAVSDDNVGAVVQICRHLDGIALAIELAAARVTTLNVHQLLERLKKEFRLLKGDERTVHPRYQTMRAALDWSYEWLSEAEKLLFRLLGIFRGGWTLKTIYACGVDEALDEFSVLDRLWPLVSKSLIAVEFRDQSQRYRLMEPLRQYAVELLKEHGELEDAARRHASYFHGVVREAASKFREMPELDWLAGIEEEFDNIRAAVEWSLLQRNDPLLGARLVQHLGSFLFTRHYHEGLRWLELAYAAVPYDIDSTLNVAVAADLARAYSQAQTADALRVCEAAIGPARLVSEELHLRRLLFFYGWALITLNRLEEAEAAIKESLEKAERAGDAYRVAVNYAMLARVNRRRGAFDVARDFWSRMTEVFEAMKLPLDRNRWTILTERALVEQLSGNADRAIELCREAYSVTQLTQDPLGAVQAQYFLAVQLFMAGEIDEAREHAQSVIKTAHHEFLPHGITFGLQVLAGIAALRGKHELAAQLIGYVESRARLQTLPRNAFVDVDPETFIRPLREHFDSDILAKLMAEGALWSQDRAIEEALAVSGLPSP